jgi:hypothetical protein
MEIRAEKGEITWDASEIITSQLAIQVVVQHAA